MVSVLLALSLSLAAALTDRSPREPTEKWVVDFAASQCVASRAYGTAADPLFLVLKAPPMGDVMQLSVVRGGGWVSPTQINATIQADQAAPLQTSMVMFGNRGRKERIYQVNLPTKDFAAIKGSTGLSIRAGALSVNFRLSQMKELIDAMDGCVADLREVWNIVDRERLQPRLKQVAVGSLQGIFRHEDYPSVSLAADSGGAVQFAILIDEEGKIADCTVIQTSGVAALDAQSCIIVRQRAKFQPAVGVDGKPAKDWAIQRVVWRIEGL